MIYLISKKEISRRKKAYITLSISLIVGFILASIVFNSPIVVSSCIPIIGTIFLLGIVSFKFFRNISQTKISLSDQTLERTIKGTSEKYHLDKINRIKIKWTSKNTIREIYIWLDNNKSIFVTALDHFEEFRKDLLDRLDKNIAIKEIHEPLNYDHPLFYSILGLPLSAICVLVFKLIPSMNYQSTKIVLIIFSIYLFVFGLYFLISKPISKRSGNKTITSDYIVGILMICLGLIISFIFITRN
jgi:hypothetical protein